MVLQTLKLLLLNSFIKVQNFPFGVCWGLVGALYPQGILSTHCFKTLELMHTRPEKLTLLASASRNPYPPKPFLMPQK